MRWPPVLLVGLALLGGGCSPTVSGLGPNTGVPVLAGDHVLTADGARLPLRVWLPDAPADAPPRAVIVALHGFNDYSRSFEKPALYWAGEGIATYAWDQRGFGETATRGLWPGTDALVEDLRTMARLVRARHPGVPVYAAGVSMGGSVILAALGSRDPPVLDGAILSAAGITGKRGISGWERAALWIGAHTIPWATVTGEGIEIHPSDNIDMLRALGRDPVMLKKARIDALHGLIRLTDEALEAAPRVGATLLVLYGQNEDIVPRASRAALLSALPADGGWRFAEYAQGYHLLLRDLNAPVVLQDIAVWTANTRAALPSGAERPDRTLVPRSEGGGENKKAR